MAFLAVLREGLETSVFLVAAFHAVGRPAAGGPASCSGSPLAAGLGLGDLPGRLRVNLARFFRVTGVVLVLVAAGLVASPLHTAPEAGWSAGCRARRPT